MKRIILMLSLCIISGCATGKLNYTPPEKTQVVNSKVIKSSKEKVWSKAIPKLGKSFFQINNIDKASGLLNVSFSADPNKYVDCGTLHTQVQNARGTRKYDINLSDKLSQYETFSNSTLWAVTRQLSLEGRINLIFESVSSTETKVTANAKYVLNMSNRSVGGLDNNYRPFDTTTTNAASFDSNSSGSFNNGGQTICYANGKLESELLSLIE